MKQPISHLFGLPLTKPESETIERIHADLESDVKHPLTLEILLRNWSNVIEQISAGYEFGMFDYTNDVSTRKVIESQLPKCPSRIQSRFCELLAPLDEKFFELTDIDPCVSSPSEKNKWDRIPKEPKGDLMEFLIIHGHRSRPES